MRWSQTVRLNLANDNRKIAINSLVLTKNDTINISNQDYYAVADFQKILDFGQNVLADDIADNSIFPVGSITLRDSSGDYILTTENIEALMSISDNSAVILNYLTYDSVNDIIISSRSVNVSGFIKSEKIETNEIIIGDDTVLKKDYLIFRHSDVSGIYSYLSKDKIEFNDSSGYNLEIGSNKLKFENENGELLFQDGKLYLNDINQNTTIEMNSSPNTGESYIQLVDSSGNTFSLNPSSFESNYSNTNIKLDEGEFIINNSANNEQVGLLNDTSGVRIEIKDDVNSFEFYPDLISGKNAEGSIEIENGGNINISNIDNTKSLSLIGSESSIKILDLDSSGICKINSDSFKIQSVEKVFQFENGIGSFSNTTDTNEVLIHSSPGSDNEMIEITDGVSNSVKISNEFIKIGDTSGNLSLSKNGISYSPPTMNETQISELDIDLSGNVNDFGPEFKVYVHYYDASGNDNSSSLVILVNMGTLMNTSKNTETSRVIEEYINSRYTDHIISYDNLKNDTVMYKRIDGKVTLNFVSNRSVSYSVMRVS